MNYRMFQNNPQENYESLVFNSILENIVCIVERFVTLKRTQSTLGDGDLPSSAAPHTPSMIKSPTKTFCLKDAEYVMMNGPFRSGFGWRGPWICML